MAGGTLRRFLTRQGFDAPLSQDKLLWVALAVGVIASLSYAASGAWVPVPLAPFVVIIQLGFLRKIVRSFLAGYRGE